MTKWLKRPVAVISTMLVVAIGQAAAAVPAKATDCIPVITDGDGNGVVEVCVSAGVNGQGEPHAAVNVIYADSPDNRFGVVDVKAGTDHDEEGQTIIPAGAQVAGVAGVNFRLEPTTDEPLAHQGVCVWIGSPEQICPVPLAI
jgi:hypothetical protein